MEGNIKLVDCFLASLSYYFGFRPKISQLDFPRVRVNQHIHFPLSAFRFLLSAFRSPRLLALPTEAWQGVKSGRRSAENIYIDLPGPISPYFKVTFSPVL